MSYFEPSRQPFLPRRIGSLAGFVDWIAGLAPIEAAAAALLLTAYVAAACVLCSAGLVASLVTGLGVAVVLAALFLAYGSGPSLARRIAYTLIVALGTPVLLVPAIVFVALGFWLLISLPLWLYRA